MRIKKVFIILLAITAMFLFANQSSTQAGQTQKAWDDWFLVNKYANGTNWTGTVLMIFNNFNNYDTGCPSLTSADLEFYIQLKHGNNLATFHGETPDVCVSVNIASPESGGQGQALQDFITDVVVEDSTFGLGGICPEAGCLMSQNNATAGLATNTPIPGDHPQYWFFANIVVAVP